MRPGAEGINITQHTKAVPPTPQASPLQPRGLPGLEPSSSPARQLPPGAGLVARRSPVWPAEWLPRVFLLRGDWFRQLVCAF